MVFAAGGFNCVLLIYLLNKDQFIERFSIDQILNDINIDNSRVFRGIIMIFEYYDKDNLSTKIYVDYKTNSVIIENYTDDIRRFLC